MATTGQDSGNATYLAPPPYYQNYWLICESLLVVLTLGTTYLTGCLLRHAVVRKPKTREQKVWQKAWLKWLAVASSGFLLLRLCSDHTAAFYAWRSDDYCFITVTVSTVLFTLSLFSLYVFLWVRQSVFYSNPIMKKIMPPALTYVSWFTLVFMLATGVTLGVIYNVPQVTKWEYQATDDGCKEVSTDSPEILPSIMAGCTVLFQVTLLALFVYPLLSRETAKFRAYNQSTQSTNGNEKYQTSTLSRSDDSKPGKEEEEDDDGVFHEPQKGNSSKSPTGRYATKPISPLAKQAFDFGRRPFSGDTDTESGADTPKHGILWATNRTIKRETPSPSHIERTQKRKSVFERLQSVKSGSIFYRRAKSNSLSSENTGSPAVSDSEHRASLGRRTLLRKQRAKSKKDNEKGRKLIIMMKKYAMLMFACVVTDLIAVAIQVSEVLPELVFLVIYDMNLIINLICIVMTFGEWKKILVPCATDTQEKGHTIATHKLRRKPTPLRKKRNPSRVEELRKEGRGQSSAHSSRRSSASGYESGEPGVHIYRPLNEMKSLLPA